MNRTVARLVFCLMALLMLCSILACTYRYERVPTPKGPTPTFWPTAVATPALNTPTPTRYSNPVNLNNNPAEMSISAASRTYQIYYRDDWDAIMVDCFPLGNTAVQPNSEVAVARPLEKVSQNVSTPVFASCNQANKWELGKIASNQDGDLLFYELLR